jgi:rhodanese-related sulfurtransferase
MRLQRLLMALVATGLVSSCGEQSADVSSSLEIIAQSAAKQQDRVTAEQMADWIISKKRDYRLLDIRHKDEFGKGHIEGAENIPLASLVLTDTLADLPRERKLVVYANGSEQAAKASVLLRVAGFDAYLLLGGYNHWQERILNPDIPTQAADDEAPEEALKRAISCYFAAPGERSVVELKPQESKPKPKGFIPPLAPAGGADGERPPADEGC